MGTNPGLFLRKYSDWVSRSSGVSLIKSEYFVLLVAFNICDYARIIIINIQTLNHYYATLHFIIILRTLYFLISFIYSTLGYHKIKWLIPCLKNILIIFLNFQPIQTNSYKCGSLILFAYSNILFSFKPTNSNELIIIASPFSDPMFL